MGFQTILNYLNELPVSLAKPKEAASLKHKVLQMEKDTWDRLTIEMKARCLFELDQYDEAIAEAKKARALTRDYEHARIRYTNLITECERAKMRQPVIEQLEDENKENEQPDVNEKDASDDKVVIKAAEQEVVIKKLKLTSPPMLQENDVVDKPINVALEKAVSQVDLDDGKADNDLIDKKKPIRRQRTSMAD